MSMPIVPAPRDGVDLEVCTEPEHIPRFFAFLIDNMVFLCFVGVAFWLGEQVSGDSQVAELGVMLIVWLISPVLGGLFEGSRLHATPGKLLFRLKVVQRDGTYPTIGQAMQRNAAKWIGLSLCNLLALTVFFDDYDRGCWDAVANTLVVRIR